MTEVKYMEETPRNRELAAAMLREERIEIRNVDEACYVLGMFRAKNLGLWGDDLPSEMLNVTDAIELVFERIQGKKLPAIDDPPFGRRGKT